jgi:putative IMPACT (imprinted ancient) family translation regulator
MMHQRISVSEFAGARTDLLTQRQKMRRAHTLVARGEISRFKKCKFQACVLRIEAAEDVAGAVAEVTRDKKVRKATHGAMYAWRVDALQSGCDDSGESGAGRRLLQLLERRRAENTFIAVTRWYGGSHLGGARFRAITSCAKELLARTSPG